jgi:hypothetical protein
MRWMRRMRENHGEKTSVFSDERKARLETSVLRVRDEEEGRKGKGVSRDEVGRRGRRKRTHGQILRTSVLRVQSREVVK